MSREWLSKCCRIRSFLRGKGPVAAAFAAAVTMQAGASKAAPLPAASSPRSINQSIHRLAIVVSANNGGRARVPLRDAGKDAQVFATVLEDLGGVGSEDGVMVDSATRAAISGGLAVLRTKLVAAAAHGERLEVLFYYSGHSNEYGLLLGNDLYSYKELKDAVTSLPAEAKIMVIDSCESGHLIANKGSLS